MWKNEIKLVLDSSSSPLTLALRCNGKTYRASKSGIKQEGYLFALIQKLYAKAGCAFKDTNSFFFIKGPGRFTGIRIAVTLAAMLKELAGAQIASANVFDLLHWQAVNSKEFKTWASKNEGGLFAAVVHAFREEYFLQIFDGSSAPQWLTLPVLSDILKQQKKPLFIAGCGKDNKPLKEILPGNFTFASDKLNKVQAPALLDFIPAPQTVQETLEPLYLKPARFEAPSACKQAPK